MIREKPIRLPAWMNASVTEPDWAIPATPPRGSHGLTSPMYVAAFVVRSTMPMQFGSEERDPVVAGDRGDLALHPGRGLAALDDAAAGDDDARHAGARPRPRRPSARAAG